MKKLICILIFMLFLPCLCFAQSIFIDYQVTSEIDQSLFWVMTDANAIKYRGCNTIALGVDPNAYVESHKAEWLAGIYTMNTDPNIPDWVDTHMGKYQIGLDYIDNIDTWAEQRTWDRKVFKAVYPVVGLPD